MFDKYPAACCGDFYSDANLLFTYQDIIDITYPTNELNSYGIYYTSQSIWNPQKAFVMWHEFCKSQPIIIDIDELIQLRWIFTS
jgi:hypothetical protein